MYTLLRLISIFSVMMLVACPKVPQSTLKTYSQVSLDPTVPTTISGKITNVISPLSNLSTLNGSIETTDQEALVFALNADEEIVMAGIAVGEKKTVMSAESTALVLVRMALLLPESLTEKNLYLIIRKAKSFSLLVSAVKLCFDKGLLASEDASVVGLVQTVVDEVGELISSSKNSTSSSVVGVVVSLDLLLKRINSFINTFLASLLPESKLR